MINRTNWELVKKYLLYRVEIDQVSDKTVRLEETWLKYFLTWLDKNSIDQAPGIRPTFPEYVQGLLTTKGQDHLSPVYMRKIISSAKRFLEWLVRQKRGYFHKVNQAWLDTLKLPRLPDKQDDHEAVTIEEVRAMANAQVHSMRDRRIRAAAVLWFLSGIRVGAFVTLPIKSVNLERNEIYQWPAYGVHTKFGKRGTTYLLNIPDLLAIVKDWDVEVRKNLSETNYWFAPLSIETGTFDASICEIGSSRESRAYKDLKDWLCRVGLPFHSPHKFRHGYAVYGIKHAKTYTQLKAISQNLMHSSIAITDGIYGMLSYDDMKRQLDLLTTDQDIGKDRIEELITQLSALLEQKNP
jgi:site-specific recombinase XerC